MHQALLIVLKTSVVANSPQEQKLEPVGNCSRSYSTNRGDSCSFNKIHIHTYINGLIQNYDLAFHTTYSVCVNFIHEWQDLQFNIDSERQIYWEAFSWQVFFTLKVFATNLLRGNRRRSIFFFIFRWLYIQ